MAVSKIAFDGHTLIDLTNDTATEQSVEKGKTFHKADGNIGTGTADVVHSETISEEAYELDIPESFYADVKKIGGKSVKWNVLSKTDHMAEQTFTLSNDITTTTRVIDIAKPAGEIKVNHIFYFSCEIYCGMTSATLVNLRFGNFRFPIYGVPLNVYTEYSAIHAITSGNYYELELWTDNAKAGEQNKAKNVYFIDLTAIFGAGNEPTSVDDERIAYLKEYAERHPEYDGGSIVNAMVTEVKGTSTLQLPSITSLPDYGAGVGDVYNYVDFVEKKYHRRVASIDLGTLNWATNANYPTARYCDIPNIKVAPIDKFASMISLKYNNTGYGAVLDGSVPYAIGVNPTFGRIWVDASLEEPNGPLCYELATEEIYDATPYIPSSLLDVENASTITFENDAHLEVPIEVKLLAKGSDIQPRMMISSPMPLSIPNEEEESEETEETEETLLGDEETEL